MKYFFYVILAVFLIWIARFVPIARIEERVEDSAGRYQFSITRMRHLLPKELQYNGYPFNGSYPALENDAHIFSTPAIVVDWKPDQVAGGPAYISLVHIDPDFRGSNREVFFAVSHGETVLEAIVPNDWADGLQLRNPIAFLGFFDGGWTLLAERDDWQEPSPALYVVVPEGSDKAKVAYRALIGSTLADTILRSVANNDTKTDYDAICRIGSRIAKWMLLTYFQHECLR